MHPAFSVLFFTVTSGIGYGMMIALMVLHLCGLTKTLETQQFLITALAALAFISAGLLSSTFHLANPKNVWRALNRFRSSWLSREGVFALLYYPIMLSYLALVWQHNGQLNAAIMVLGLLLIVLSIIVLLCTAMIYASLKTIPQWNNPLTVVNFLIFSLMSGSLFMSAAYSLATDQNINALIIISLLLIVAGMISKLAWFNNVGKPSGTTIQTATSFSQAQARLLDAGHSADTFINKEFGYRVGPKTLSLARKTSLILGFILPALALVIALTNQSTDINSTDSSAIILSLACISIYLGLLLERWLFFVEATHVVRFYEMPTTATTT